MKEKLTNIIDEIIKGMLKDAGVNEEVTFSLVIPEKEEHGDFACNAAMQLVKHLKKNPKIIAEDIINKLNEKLKLDCTIAGPGFINIKIDVSWYAETVMNIINNEKYFHNNIGGGKKAMVEFVSANPTGPLHIGHGRGAAYGDSVARLLEMSGYDVLREYYVNDAGNQMNNLALSVYARAAEILGKGSEVPFPEAGYHGDYIIDIAKELLTTHANILEIDRKEALEICLGKAVQTIQADIDNDLKEFRVTFHNYFSEKSLYKNKLVESTLKELEKSGKVFEQDGALWLKTTDMGDDKDRVLRKTDGSNTYLTADIAYHHDKIKRGFDKLINIWGADHHGYVARMRASIEALGDDPNKLEVLLGQLVNIVLNGEATRMGKRKNMVTLEDLIDEVGVDATRYWMIIRSIDTTLDFDIELAKSKTDDNPVFYVQYAHARACSIFRNAKTERVNIETKEKTMKNLLHQPEN